MQAIDHASVNTLRFLAADQVEKAKSGHPGFPLGTAPLMYTLWDRFTIQKILTGSIVTVLFCRQDMAALCCMQCCIWPATMFR